MIIQSGNDASVALAEHVAGNEENFVYLMNEYASELGMNNTSFNNASGLPDPLNVTSAYDLALLTGELIKNFPDHYRHYSQKSFEFNGIKQKNRNQLLWRDDIFDGVKTGYTESAGYCLVGSAVRDDMRLVAVVLVQLFFLFDLIFLFHLANFFFFDCTLLIFLFEMLK